VWKVYPGPEAEVVALAGTRLEVQTGSYVAIMGPSSSGKSTLLGILGCLDTPGRGRYLPDGTPVEKLMDDGMATIRNFHYPNMLSGG
jgi:putative ABC transport system ATP-binding protein